MSFGKLKSARKTKELHSVVTSTPTHSTNDSDAPGTETLGLGETSAGSAAHDASEGSRNQEMSRATASEKTGVDPPQSESQSTQEESSSPQVVKEKTKPAALGGCYRSLPATVEIRESSSHGRGAYAKSALSAGSVVMSMTPHVSVLSTGNLDQFCSACAGSAPADRGGLKRCPRCQTVFYCDSECQNRDWAWHKRECNALRKWAASAPSETQAIPGEAVRCLGRLLWRSQAEGLGSHWAQEVRMMHSNRSSLQPSAFESHTHLAHSVVRYLGVSSPQELEPYGLNSAGDLVDLISRFTTNTFTLTAPSLSPIGVCVAPAAAFANHSCDPNAVIVFPRLPSAPAVNVNEPLLELVALRDIPDGNEIRISYVDTTLPTALRRKELLEVYSFTCQCTLCTHAGTDPREALWCPKDCGGICPYPVESEDSENKVASTTRCAKCSAAIDEPAAVLDVLRVGQEALDKASVLQFTDPEKARQLTTNVLPLLTAARATPASHPLLALTRLHQELLIAALPSDMSQALLDETIRAAASYSAGLQALLPKGHPVRAVALGELGKLLAVDEPSPGVAGAGAGSGGFPPSGPARLKLAYEALVKAHEELLVGFGRAGGGGQLGREVREAVVQLEKELGIWMSGVMNVLQDTAAARVGPSSK